MDYIANADRYNKMTYRRCGKSGIDLPLISLGLWQNFGSLNPLENSRKMLQYAFDSGITYFDLANNYGPVYGSAEETFGIILKKDLMPYRDELIIASKAGYDMWDGPYGNWGSKKYLVSSLDQSLKRMNLEYVDIFYHHRPDPKTPIEETMDALLQIIRQGKALYVGLSNYDAKQTKEASQVIRSMGGKLLVHQPSYSMYNRWIEEDLQDVLDEEGIGSVAFCPLFQGLLTSRYFNGIPENSRVSLSRTSINHTQPNEALINKSKKLNEIAQDRGQSLAQMALSWALRGERLTSCIIGASRVSQIEENVACINNLDFSEDELNKIDEILSE